MENNKSPGNNGITIEFCFTFWDEVRAPLLLAIEKQINRKKRTQQLEHSKLATYFFN